MGKTGEVSNAHTQAHYKYSCGRPVGCHSCDEIGIQNLPVEEKEGCRTCEWKYWCTGGCSLATHRATGRYDVTLLIAISTKPYIQKLYA